MFRNKAWPPAAVAAGLVALAALIGCGPEPSVAIKSAAAFKEAQKEGRTFEGAGHTHGHGAPTPSAPTPEVAELPAQPAGILRPDAFDAPAATSVVDAQRSAEMNQAMSGGHGGHGAGTYRQIDAGRGPGAGQSSKPQPPGAGPRHHDHGAAEPQASLYVCPMHPEVTSKTPGTCPKCGMTLVERREE